MQLILKILLIGLISILTSCKSIGPRILTVDRYHYNLAMGNSTQQELLLNLVRLRYDETPVVLKVGNISGSTSLRQSSGATGRMGFPGLGLTTGEVELTGNLEFSDNPIISYTPLEDRAFTSQYLQALDLEDIALLLKSGWSIPRVFRVTLQQAGNAMNAPSAARSTSSHPPHYQEFIDMVYALRRMQLEDAITVFYHKDKGIEELTLHIKSNFKLTAKEMNALSKAGVTIHNHRIVFTNRPQPQKVYVVTRSMLGVMNYLSKGVTVPREDFVTKVATETTLANGQPFDWQSVLKGMMKICVSKNKPKNAIVAIPHRGRWYYVSDSDSDSKQTLILLTNIAGLIMIAPPGSEDSVGITRAI